MNITGVIILGLMYCFTLQHRNTAPENVESAIEVSILKGTVYEVGPGKGLTSLHQVPWGKLMPGDKVLIYWRNEPYKEKFALSRMGSENAPIVVSGVPGPNGQLPVLDGKGATVVSEFSFPNDNRCVIKVGSARFEGSQPPRNVGHIIIENLDVRSAHEDHTYIDRGTEKKYSKNASPIYVEYADNIIIRNNIFSDSGNGLFTTSNCNNVLVEGNYLIDNGVLNSIYEHNVYMAGKNLIFQYNYFGPLKKGSSSIGNNIKTRGAGEVIRYNFIEGGNRALDLVDGGSFANDPSYHETHVYGNVIVDIGQGTNPAMVHYGGDSGNYDRYRRGTLYFYNNTVVNMRPRNSNQAIFQLDKIDQKVVATNNIFYFTSENAYLKGSSNGTYEINNNWIVAHWKLGREENELTETKVSINGMLTGESPGFISFDNQDFRLAAGSACINVGSPLHPKVQSKHDVLFQYVKHQSAEKRPQDGKMDIGAYEAVK
jgi:hypothetical protein